MSDLINILSNDADPNEEMLKKYLNGSASEEERFAIENQMAEDPFMNEAVEGLQSFNDPATLQDYVTQLNKQLQQQTAKKKKRKLKRRLKDQKWTILSIMLILGLCVLAYLTIHLSNKKNKPSNTGTNMLQKK